MLGWMDDEALARTLTTGRATYWSRSRQEYWVKGDTSGHVQHVREVRLDCDGDTLLVKVDQVGAACHTGDRTCFDADRLDGRSMAEPQARTFGPVVLLGLASGGAGGRRRHPRLGRACRGPASSSSGAMASDRSAHGARRDAARRCAEPRAPRLLGRRPGDPPPGPPRRRRPGRRVRARPAGDHDRRRLHFARLLPRLSWRRPSGADGPSTAPSPAGTPQRCSPPSAAWSPRWPPYASRRPGRRWARATTRLRARSHRSSPRATSSSGRPSTRVMTRRSRTDP